MLRSLKNLSEKDQDYIRKEKKYMAIAFATCFLVVTAILPLIL